jgi:hypothetical protein
MLIHQSAKCESTTPKWMGKWYLNDQDTVFGGVMEIFDCVDTTCDFKLESWYDLHICDVEGKIEISGDKAEYNSKKYQYDRVTDTEYFIPVGILFQMELVFIGSYGPAVFCRYPVFCTL